MKEIKFQKLELQNFRCHDTMEFNFDPNRFVIITGRNGVGKTTIFDALCWCLFDMTTKKRTGDAVLRKRYPKNCFVKIRFLNGDDIYDIHNYRKDKDHGSEKFIFKNGNNISGTTRSDTNKIIENLLLPFEVFRICLMFSQYMDKNFTEMTDGNKKDILDKILSLEQYDVYREKVSEKIKEIINKVAGFESSIPICTNTISHFQQNLDNEKSEISEYINECELEKSEILTEIDQRKKENDGWDERLKLLIPLQEEVKDHRIIFNERCREVERIAEKIQSNTENIRDACRVKFEGESKDLTLKVTTDLHTIDSEIIILNSNLETTDEQERGDIDRLLAAKEEKKVEIQNRYNGKLSDLEFSRTRLLNDLRIMADQLDSILETIISLNSKVEKTRAHLEKPSPTCYTCGQDIDLKLKKQFIGELEQDINELNELNGKKVKLEDDKNKTDYDRELATEQLTVVTSELNGLLEQVDSKFIDTKRDIEKRYSEKKKSTYDKITNLESRKLALTSEMETTISTLREQLRLEGATELAVSNKKLQESLEVSEQQCSTVKDLIFRCESSISELTDINKKFDYNSDRIQMLESNLNLLLDKISKRTLASHDKIAGLNENIDLETAKLAELNKNINEAKVVHEILKFWQKAFSDQGIKSIIMDESIPMMNKKARELSGLTDFIQVRFDTQTTLKSGDSRNKFSVDVIQTKHLTDDRADFSAGEGKLVDIITLLCLREVLERSHDIRFNIYLFDEVLDSLDPENAVVVVDMIKKLSEDFCVILISHTLRDYIDADENLPM